MNDVVVDEARVGPSGVSARLDAEKAGHVGCDNPEQPELIFNFNNYISRPIPLLSTKYIQQIWLSTTATQHTSSQTPTNASCQNG
jgi:hypothetical protein